MTRKPPRPPIPFRSSAPAGDSSAPPTPALLLTGRITGTVLNPQREAIVLPTIPPDFTIAGVVIVLANGQDENGNPKRVGMLPWTASGLNPAAILTTLRNMIDKWEKINVMKAKAEGGSETEKEPS